MTRNAVVVAVFAIFLAFFALYAVIRTNENSRAVEDLRSDVEHLQARVGR